jgi:hypothetical protein
VNKVTQSHYGEPAAYRRAHNAISLPDQSESESSPAPGAALMIVVLSSLGLWWVIWLAVSLSASALA